MFMSYFESSSTVKCDFTARISLLLTKNPSNTLFGFNCDALLCVFSNVCVFMLKNSHFSCKNIVTSLLRIIPLLQNYLILIYGNFPFKIFPTKTLPKWYSALLFQISYSLYSLLTSQQLSLLLKKSILFPLSSTISFATNFSSFCCSSCKDFTERPLLPLHII